MRQNLKAMIEKFINGEMTIEELRQNMGPIVTMDLTGQLTKEEHEKVRDFFAWYVDMYDSRFQPSTGRFAKTKDVYAQVFRGEYRVDLDAVISKAKEIVSLLSTASNS